MPSELAVAIEPLIHPAIKDTESPLHQNSHIKDARNNHKIPANMTAPSEARHIVNFITGNANKLREVKEILEPAIQVESQALDLLEIQGTLEEVTLDKCRRAADLVTIASSSRPNHTSQD